MAWCRQATSHYLGQCWPRSMSSYDVTRPHCVDQASVETGIFRQDYVKIMIIAASRHRPWFIDIFYHFRGIQMVAVLGRRCPIKLKYELNYMDNFFTSAARYAVFETLVCIPDAYHPYYHLDSNENIHRLWKIKVSQKNGLKPKELMCGI